MSVERQYHRTEQQMIRVQTPLHSLSLRHPLRHVPQGFSVSAILAQGKRITLHCDITVDMTSLGSPWSLSNTLLEPQWRLWFEPGAILDQVTGLGSCSNNTVGRVAEIN